MSPPPEGAQQVFKRRAPFTSIRDVRLDANCSVRLLRWMLNPNLTSHDKQAIRDAFHLMWERSSEEEKNDAEGGLFLIVPADIIEECEL